MTPPNAMWFIFVATVIAACAAPPSNLPPARHVDSTWAAPAAGAEQDARSVIQHDLATTVSFARCRKTSMCVRALPLFRSWVVTKDALAPLDLEREETLLVLDAPTGGPKTRAFFGWSKATTAALLASFKRAGEQPALAFSSRHADALRVHVPLAGGRWVYATRSRIFPASALLKEHVLCAPDATHEISMESQEPWRRSWLFDERSEKLSVNVTFDADGTSRIDGLIHLAQGAPPDQVRSLLSERIVEFNSILVRAATRNVLSKVTILPDETDASLLRMKLELTADETRSLIDLAAAYLGADLEGP